MTRVQDETTRMLNGEPKTELVQLTLRLTAHDVQCANELAELIGITRTRILERLISAAIADAIELARNTA